MEKKLSESAFDFSDTQQIDKLKKLQSETSLDMDEEECNADGVCKRKSTLQKFSKEVFIKNLQIVDFQEQNGHVSYYIAVRGRTKYLVNLNDLTSLGLISNAYMLEEEQQTNDGEGNPKFQMVEYCVVKRYSELLTFHKILQQEMKNYMKKKGFREEDFPEFPPKKLFNKSKCFIERRSHLLNQYFLELFQKFPEKIPYTNALIDLCQPFKLNIAVIGSKESGKSSLIQSVVYTLAELANYKEQLKRQLWDDNYSQSDKNAANTESIPQPSHSISDDFTFKMPIAQDPPLQKSVSDAANKVQSQLLSSQTMSTGGDVMSQNSKKSKKKEKYRDMSRGGTKMVFNKQKNGETMDSGTIKVNKKVESYFPLDVAFEGVDGKNLLFRLDIQEYQIDENDLKSLLSHLIQSDEKNAIMFTFDMTQQTSFKIYLKKAIKELIFAYEDLPEEHKSKKMIPFMLVGMKNDIFKKQKVNKTEVKSLLTALQKHVNCDLYYVQNTSIEDTVNVLKCMFDLASSSFFYESPKKKPNDK